MLYAYVHLHLCSLLVTNSLVVKAMVMLFPVMMEMNRLMNYKETTCFLQFSMRIDFSLLVTKSKETRKEILA